MKPKEITQEDITFDAQPNTNKPKKPMCCAFCASLFRDVDDNFKCLEHSNKQGNELIYGIDNLIIVDNLRNHCGVFSQAKPPLKINTIAMEKRLIRKKKELEPKKQKPEYGQFGLLIEHINSTKEHFEGMPNQRIKI